MAGSTRATLSPEFIRKIEERFPELDCMSCLRDMAAWLLTREHAQNLAVSVEAWVVGWLIREKRYLRERAQRRAAPTVYQANMAVMDNMAAAALAERAGRDYGNAPAA